MTIKHIDTPLLEPLASPWLTRHDCNKKKPPAGDIFQEYKTPFPQKSL